MDSSPAPLSTDGTGQAATRRGTLSEASTVVDPPKHEGREDSGLAPETGSLQSREHGSRSERTRMLILLALISWAVVAAAVLLIVRAV